ncbi:MAG: acyl-CoA dehydrogenase family protein [Actinomycetota bacterium]|nr:acyl-CoA dehydrogenase family protein [Actinomycetota bacterium]
MDFELTEAQRELRALAAEVAEREFRPRAARWDENEEYPEENLAVLAKQGFTGLTVPEEFGGLGVGDIEAALVLEEIARVCLSTAVLCQLHLNGPPRAIDAFGSDDLKERYLPRVAAGDCLIGIGMTEPDAGSDAMNMRAKLRRTPEGLRLDAYKNMVTAGHKAQAYFVVARFDGAGDRAIGAMLVPAGAPGSEVSKVHKKMGLRGVPEAEVAFDNTPVDEADIILEGDGDGQAMRTILGQFNHERLGNAAMCTGVADGALDESIRYAQERTVGGKRIIELQGIAWKLAEMSTKVEAARLMVWRACAAADAAGHGVSPPAIDVARAKWFANIVAQEVCNEAIQIHGGYGYTREFPVERMFRDVRGLAIGAGTVEVQKNLIGRLLDKEGPRPRP